MKKIVQDMRNPLLHIIIILVLSGCGTFKKPFVDVNNKGIAQLPTSALSHKVYMVGDAGGLDVKDNKVNHVIQFVHSHLNQDTTDNSLVYLGDNIYNAGLHKKSHEDRKREEAILDAHLAVTKGNDTDVYFIPGNHDWNDNRRGGLEAIQRQQKYIKANGKGDNINMYPKNGCGDPKVIKVNKGLAFVFVDSQWWVHNWDKEEDINKGCKVKSRREFLDRIKNIIIEHKNDQIMVFMHHPLVSNGEHGGRFSAKTHLIPVPVFGSIYALSRQLGISNQDNTNELLRELHNYLKTTIHGFDASQVMFVSGHDHFLQHTSEQVIFQKFPIHYVISGSGYKEGYAAKGLGASFVYSQRGYSVMNIYEDGSAWLEFYTVSDDGQNEALAYRQMIYEKKPRKETYDYVPSHLTKDKVTLAPNPNFEKGKVFRYLLGDQYREAWTTPVEADVFKLNILGDELYPVKKGGGLFSRTLRLENSSGKQYVLRSMNKDFYKAVPKNLEHLELLKLYADQNTASIPYGALYVAALSDYAKVYHTAPSMVYLEDIDELGPFKPFFPKGHYLLEARPDGDWSDAKLFGGSEQVIGYNDLVHILKNEATHIVDQKWTLRSRLFDILIHDRDRHDDQWRWAAFEEGEMTVYRPVPRDRDWAFFKYKGLIPSIIGNVVDKKFKTFKGNAIDVKSLSFNANNFDRFFLNELTWADWQEELSFLRQALSSEAISKSFDALPPEARPYLREELEAKLNERLSILEQKTKPYYDFISEEVEISGSDEEDIFDLTVMENGNLQIKHYRDKRSKKRLRYNRILDPADTKEVRIYGLAGQDEFNIFGAGETDVTIRIIGGIGKDKIIFDNKDGSTTASVYDSPDGMEINDMSRVNDHRDDELQTNEYKRNGFLYDTGFPWLNIGLSPDDGFLIGAGFQSIKHKWRKSPFASSHFFNFELTPSRGFGLELNYEGEFTDAFGKGWAFNPELFVESPSYINFFGLGDNSDIMGARNSFNWVNRSSWGAQLNLLKSSSSNRIKFRLGPEYESHDINPEEGSILLQLAEFGEDDFERTHFVGVHADIEISTLDRNNHPTRGFHIEGFARQQYNLQDQKNIGSLGGTIAFFIPLSVEYPIVFGSNTGYHITYGDPLFYQLPTIGGKDFFRPSRSERFRGESVLFQQFDLRTHLFSWNNSILPMRIGSIAGYDIGQNYYNGEDTGSVKHGWTLGLSYDILSYFVLRTSVSGSNEGTFFVFDTGFNF